MALWTLELRVDVTTHFSSELRIRSKRSNMPIPTSYGAVIPRRCSQAPRETTANQIGANRRWGRDLTKLRPAHEIHSKWLHAINVHFVVTSMCYCAKHRPCHQHRSLERIRVRARKDHHTLVRYL